MNEHADIGRKVVYLRPSDARAARLRCVAARAADVARVAGAVAAVAVGLALAGLWSVLRLALCALLVMIEPLLRVTLVPVAFLGFVVTLIFGFLIGAPGFPKWGMLAFSIGALALYWLFLALMGLVLKLPRDHR
jgi:hypothetical protein